MSSRFVPRWFSTPDGRTVYALEQPDHLVEHQRLGARYLVHRLAVQTYADRLHIAGLIERLESGLLRELTEDAYRAEVRNIEQLERMGGDPE